MGAAMQVPEAILRESRLFTAMSSEDIKALVSACDEKLIIQGEELFLEGDPGDSIWVLVSGRVEIFKHIRGGVDRVIHILQPGGVVGEVSFIDGSARSAGARTLDTSEFLVLSRDSFVKVQRQRPAAAAIFCLNLLGIMAGRLRSTTELYRDSISFGLDAVGAATLNLKSISEELRSVNVHLVNGSVTGRLLQIDHHAAGYALIIKGTYEKVRLIPYHAVQWIEAT